MPKNLSNALLNAASLIEEKAKQHGLDCFPTIYEMLNYDEMNMIASYAGFPSRYPHWRFGMAYEKHSKSFAFGLSKIYEMVLNHDPCYAYLLEGNAYLDQKLVMCHVAGHNDFFKNNFAFANTNRKMIDTMANHANRIHKYMDWYGVDEVENFIDKVLSLENLIDIHFPYEHKKIIATTKDAVNTIPPNEYMDSFHQTSSRDNNLNKNLILGNEPHRDILLFLLLNAPLKRWQQDVVEILREEAYYFLPQAMTKIMNEGWASYWHIKLMKSGVLDQSEIIDFADRHSALVANTDHGLNPYRLGLDLFNDIEDRWNKGKFGAQWQTCTDISEQRAWDKKTGLGLEKIFQVRKIFSDLTFIDEFFTLDFCKRYGYFTVGFEQKTQEYVIESRSYEKVKATLLKSLTNLGQPIVLIKDANYENKGELLLEHVHEGVDLDFSMAQKTLHNIHYIWKKPVNLMTCIRERKCLLSFDGETTKETITSF